MIVFMTDAADALTDHIIDLISESGLEALSVRAVANVAGVSIGAVQHHFPTKAAMLRAALRTVAERSAERYGRASSVEDSRERLLRLLELLVPSSVDDVSARVWVAFSARALTDSEIGAVYRDLWSRLHAAIAALIVDSGVPVSTADRRATTLLALADGLTVDVLAGAVTVADGRSIMAAAL